MQTNGIPAETVPGNDSHLVTEEPVSLSQLVCSDPGSLPHWFQGTGLTD